MYDILESVKALNTIDGAIEFLETTISLDEDMYKALSFSISSHEKQFRKSGEPYVIHPILVAGITAYFSNDKSMVIAALLHDVVEDTDSTIEEIADMFGKDVAHIVDGLTKIVEIREHELSPSTDKDNKKLLASALTFRKMLLASIDDVRVLVVKLCDRLHNMLTLDALNELKQKRIAEETLVVYAPISHRLGISNIKNLLEDLSFSYLYKDDYSKISNYLQEFQQKTQLTLNNFISSIKDILEKEGYNSSDIKILSRIKHSYSIYLKMQRKGVSIDEVLDLYAIRILTKNPLDCYNILGIIHTHYKPLIARFKDYIAVPKENGYQTIHTTVFANSKIFEIQIRTFDMHNIAEFGVAAHWKYKNGGNNSKGPNLDWLEALAANDVSAEEFYDDAKEELFIEDIVVYSPKGELFTVPRGSTAFDFAYRVHTDLGNKAVEAIINKVKKPLLTQLKSGDIISIVSRKDDIIRCSWLDMVKTNKAKKSIKLLCHNRLNKIDKLASMNIVNTIFSRYKDNILENCNDLELKNFKNIVYNFEHLKYIKKVILKYIRLHNGIIARLKIQNLTLKEIKFDNILLYSNFTINNISFDHCCHPKFGDDIVAIKDGKDVVIHHKLCETAYKKMQENKNMLFCSWIKDRFYSYNMVISIPSIRGELAKVLSYLSIEHNATILFVEYGKDPSAQNQYCTIDFEIKNDNKEKVRAFCEQKMKVIEFYMSSDAYK